MYAVTVFVSLNRGSAGNTGLGVGGFFPAVVGQGAESYSKIAVAVVLSNAAFCAVAYARVAM